MSVFEMRNCLWPSTCKHTRTKTTKVYTEFLKYKTDKHMRVVETYVILGHYLHFSYLLLSLTVIILCTGFDFKKNEYNHCVYDLFLIFESKSQMQFEK